MLSDFLTWQAEAVSSFDAVLHPETYRHHHHRSPLPSGSSPSSDRSKLYPMEHRLLQRNAGARLARHSRAARQMLEACGRMVAEVRELTAIMADDKGRALFIFTAVTVVFLPLSFVASYVSMLVGGSGAGFDWPAVHALFWEVAGPLTAAVLAFCLAVAQAGAVRRALLLGLPNRVRRGRAPEVGVGSAVWGRLAAWRVGTADATVRVWSGWTTRGDGKGFHDV